jgi:hypothetical protein
MPLLNFLFMYEFLGVQSDVDDEGRCLVLANCRSCRTTVARPTRPEET